MKDLWIINKTGKRLYHYSASFSDYKIDLEMFGGFIAALASFTETLSTKQIQFMKMSDDEMYFIKDKEIIVVSIMSTSGAEQQVIEQILMFIGEKFNDFYGKYYLNEEFDWQSIVDEFTQDIEFIAGDEQVYEEMKREMINKLFSEVLQGKIPPDILNWKVAHLFSQSTPNEILKTIEMIDGLTNILPSMKHEKIIESKILSAFRQTKHQLNIKSLQNENQLLVLCHNKDIFHQLMKNFLAYATLCVNITEFDGLIAAVQSTKWMNEKISFNILIIDPILTLKEIEELLQLQIAGKIFIWTKLRSPPEYYDIFEPYPNIKLHHGYCDFENGCPRIYEIVKELGMIPQNQPIDIIIE